MYYETAIPGVTTLDSNAPSFLAHVDRPTLVPACATCRSHTPSCLLACTVHAVYCISMLPCSFKAVRIVSISFGPHYLSAREIAVVTRSANLPHISGVAQRNALLQQLLYLILGRFSHDATVYLASRFRSTFSLSLDLRADRSSSVRRASDRQQPRGQNTQTRGTPLPGSSEKQAMPPPPPPKKSADTLTEGNAASAFLHK